MKRIIIILAVWIMFPSVSFAGSIEQERMLNGIQQEQQEQQKQVQQQVNEYNKTVDETRKQNDNPPKRVYPLNVPEGYYYCPKSGKIYPNEKQTGNSNLFEYQGGINENNNGRMHSAEALNS